MIKTIFVSVICGLFMINMIMRVDGSMTEYTLPEEDEKVIISETSLSIEEDYSQALADAKLEFEKIKNSFEANKIQGLEETKTKIKNVSVDINSEAEKLIINFENNYNNNKTSFNN